MLYGKAGWAGVRVSARAINLTNNELAEFTDWSNGWTVGVGLEHVPWQSIVIGVEADFYGSISFDRSGNDNFGVPARFFDTSAPYLGHNCARQLLVRPADRHKIR